MRHLATVLTVLALLTDGYCKTALQLPTRLRRQVEEEDLGTLVTRFLTADSETQQDYLRYGLELAEYHLLEGYDEIKDKTDAQDRVFLESVQSVIDAVRNINDDPGQTPTALAELATNPDNLLLFTSLVVSTVFVAQLSSFVMFGTSLSAPLQDDGTEGEAPLTGLMAVLMELINMLVNLPVTVVNAANDIATGGEENSEDMDTAEEDMNEDGSNDTSTAEFDETKDPEECTGFFSCIFRMLGDFFDSLPQIGNRQSDAIVEGSGDETEEGSGDDEMTEDETEEGGIHIGVDVEQGSILDMLINLIPNPPDAADEDTTEVMEEGMEMTTADPGDLGTQFGGVSVSLAPIDLAGIFVQVQQIVGMNCSCADDMMTDEMITNTTMRLLEETLEEARKRNQYSSLKKDNKKQKKGRADGKKKGKKGGRRKMWTPRVPKSL